ncbi:hypothetical protein FY048_18745 [Acinetobacter sp. 1124_18A]
MSIGANHKERSFRVGIIEITHQISPSSQKNPDINLKKLKRRPDKYVKEIEPIPNLNLFPEREDS